MAEERTRLEIAFGGGQTISPVVESSVADGLTAALGGDRAGAFVLESEDGTYIVPLHAVVYVKRFSRETRIGFGRIE